MLSLEGAPQGPVPHTKAQVDVVRGVFFSLLPSDGPPGGAFGESFLRCFLNLLSASSRKALGEVFKQEHLQLFVPKERNYLKLFAPV